MADNGIPIGFVELDPEEVQKALDGQEYVLGDEQTKAEIPGMLNLIFEMVEKPTIRKTIFRGNKNVS